MATPPPEAPPPTADRAARLRWMLLGAAIAVAVVIGLIALTAKDAADRRGRHAITLAQFGGIELGMTSDAVRHELGRTPARTQQFVGEEGPTREVVERSCIYYDRRNGDFGDSFQFCFREGVLASKGEL